MSTLPPLVPGTVMPPNPAAPTVNGMVPPAAAPAAAEFVFQPPAEPVAPVMAAPVAAPMLTPTPMATSPVAIAPSPVAPMPQVAPLSPAGGPPAPMSAGPVAPVPMPAAPSPEMTQFVQGSNSLGGGGMDIDLSTVDMSNVKSGGGYLDVVPKGTVLEVQCTKVEYNGLDKNGDHNYKLTWQVIFPAQVVSKDGQPLLTEGKLLTVDSLSLTLSNPWKLRDIAIATGEFDHTLNRIKPGTTPQKFYGKVARVTTKIDVYDDKEKNKIDNYSEPVAYKNP